MNEGDRLIKVIQEFEEIIKENEKVINEVKNAVSEFRNTVDSIVKTLNGIFYHGVSELREPDKYLAHPLLEDHRVP